jgi:hypothetical protein
VPSRDNKPPKTREYSVHSIRCQYWVLDPDMEPPYAVQGASSVGNHGCYV